MKLIRTICTKIALLKLLPGANELSYQYPYQKHIHDSDMYYLDKFETCQIQNCALHNNPNEICSKWDTLNDNIYRMASFMVLSCKYAVGI